MVYVGSIYEFRFRPQLKQRMLPESRRTACAEMAREQCRTTIFHQESPWKLITSEDFSLSGLLSTSVVSLSLVIQQ